MNDDHERQKTRASDPTVWVNQHGDYLYNYAYSRLRNEIAAEDAVQETFLAALKGRRSFSGASSERTWLIGILKHKVVDYWRQAVREIPSGQVDTLLCESEKVMRDSGEWKGAWIPDRSPLDWGDDPSGNLEKKEFWKVMDSCIKALPPRMAGVFTLHEMEEISTEEICKDLNITPTNLWVILHRARRQLRRCLELNWFGGKRWPS